MGSSSKVLLVGATSLIIGTYAVSLKRVQTQEMQTAAADFNRVQNEHVLDAALRSALDTVANFKNLKKASGTMKTIDGGTFTFSATKDGGSAGTLTVTLTRNGGTRVAKALLEKVTGQLKQGSRNIHRGKWQVTKSFVSNQ
jgi:hypothetical protein